MRMTLASLDMASSSMLLTAPQTDEARRRKSQLDKQQVLQSDQNPQQRRDTLETQGLFPANAPTSANNEQLSKMAAQQIIDQVTALLRAAQQAPGQTGNQMLSKALGLVGSGMAIAPTNGLGQLDATKDSLMSMSSQIVGMMTERGLKPELAPQNQMTQKQGVLPRQNPFQLFAK